MTITAKYQGKCSECGGGIAPGTKIDWDKASKRTSHVECNDKAEAPASNGKAPASPTASTRPASPKQTGFLRTLARRLEHVRQFDSQAGSGASAARDIYDALHSGITSYEARQLIEEALGLLDDEM